MLARFFLAVFAAAFLGGGAMYLSKPKKIMDFHTSLREFLLNDAYISLHRKRIGNVLILIGSILLAVAWLGR
ncbi:MAG: hypothetical protein HY747_04390 [Elusimicrobia bacterium]|nr:hypothetical protein [Elusimicrobiota bacterium]